jgi:alanine racemase
VLKGDGYGFGAGLCAPVLAAAGFSCFAVGTPQEAAAVRAAGAWGRLIVLQPGQMQTVPEVPDIEWTVGDIDITELLRRRPQAVRVRVHVEVDFGVGRGGVAPADLDDVLGVLAYRRDIEVVGLAGELPAAPEPALLTEALACLVAGRRHCPDAMVHVGGSDVVRWAHLIPEAAIRVGRLLYGVVPRGLPQTLADGLVPAWAWQALACPFPRPPRIGYAHRQPPRGTPARLDVGYADGLPVQAAGRWPVKAGGTPYLIHEVFMLASIAYPVDPDTTLDGPAEATLSGRSDTAEVPIRSISKELAVPTTAILTCPRSPRRVQA